MNTSLLILLLSLLVIQRTQGLTAPYNVKAKIEEDTLKVTWEHENSDDSFKGYYVILEDIGSDYKESPVYVHSGPDDRCAKIIGLRPKTKYSVTVSAHSSSTHKNSASIKVNTARLELLHADGLTAKDVTNVTATLEWTHTAKNNIHHIKFKLVCKGVQTFTRNGQMMEERSTLEHESWSTSRGRESFVAKGLQPNSHYTCRLLSRTRKTQSDPGSSPQAIFHTKPGRPSRPPKPRISQKVAGKHTSQFSIELYPADDQFGKIGLYKVIAVPVSRAGGQPRTIPYRSVVPLNRLLKLTLSRKLAQKVSERVPFFVGEYESEQLPPTLEITKKWAEKPFKMDTYYSFVVVAFAKGSDKTLYTISEPAYPPVLIGHDEVQEAIMHKKQVTQRFGNIILMTMMTIIAIFAIAFLLIFVTKYYQSSKRNAYYFAVAEDSSSDEETVYIKKPPPKRTYRYYKTPTPVPPRPEGSSKAEWAVKNVHHNPVFEDTVYRSPDTLQEMETTLDTLSDYRSKQSSSKSRRQQLMDDLTEEEEILELAPVSPQNVPDVRIQTSFPPPPSPSLSYSPLPPPSPPLSSTPARHSREEEPLPPSRLSGKTPTPNLSVADSAGNAPPPPPPPLLSLNSPSQRSSRKEPKSPTPQGFSSVTKDRERSRSSSRSRERSGSTSRSRERSKSIGRTKERSGSVNRSREKSESISKRSETPIVSQERHELSSKRTESPSNTKEKSELSSKIIEGSKLPGTTKVGSGLESIKQRSGSTSKRSKSPTKTKEKGGLAETRERSESLSKTKERSGSSSRKTQSSSRKKDIK